MYIKFTKLFFEASLFLACVVAVPARSDIVSDHIKLMIKAIANDNATQVQKLLNTPYVSVEDDIRQYVHSPSIHRYIQYAAGHCKPRSLEVLIENGADVNYGPKSSPYSWPPILFAILGSNLYCSESLNILLSKGADPNLRFQFQGNGEYTVLLVSARLCLGGARREVFIRQYGGNVNATVINPRPGGYDPKWTSLHIIASSDSFYGSNQCYDRLNDYVRDHINEDGTGDKFKIQADFGAKDSNGRIPIDILAGHCPLNLPAIGYNQGKSRAIALLKKYGSPEPNVPVVVCREQ